MGPLLPFHKRPAKWLLACPLNDRNLDHSPPRRYLPLLLCPTRRRVCSWHAPISPVLSLPLRPCAFETFRRMGKLGRAGHLPAWRPAAAVRNEHTMPMRTRCGGRAGLVVSRSDGSCIHLLHPMRMHTSRKSRGQAGLRRWTRGGGSRGQQSALKLLPDSTHTHTHTQRIAVWCCCLTRTTFTPSPASTAGYSSGTHTHTGTLSPTYTLQLESWPPLRGPMVEPLSPNMFDIQALTSCIGQAHVA